MDWEAEIAGPVLDLDGKPAVYESAVDGEADGQLVLNDLLVVFRVAYVGVNAAGQPVDMHKATAMGRRSALSDARQGGLLTVNGAKYVVARMPQDDGSVWITLHLEGPIG